MKEPEEWGVEEVAAFFKKALGKPDVTIDGLGLCTSRLSRQRSF